MSHLLRFFTILILVLVFTQNLFAQCLVVQSVVTPVSCHDGANGAIDVTVTGGVGNYSFIWSNDAFSEDVTDLSPGSYHLTVTDESGCFEFVSFDLGNPPVLQGNITAKCNFNGNSYDFELTCNVQGGASPYAYNWAPFSGQNATQITPGTITTYQVTITDHAGCTTVSEKFTGKPSIDNDLPEIPIDCTNPEVVLDASQCQYLPGQTIFKWFHANQTSLFITGPTDSLVTTVNAPGLFIFNVSDTITGCSAGKWFDVVSVQGPNAFFFADAGSDVTLSCINPSVQIGGNTTPTGPNYTYAWSTTDGHITSSSNTLYATVDQGGVYTLLVTNMVSGCTSTDQVTVSTQTLPIANAGPDLGLPCGGGVVTLAPVTSGQNIAVFWIGAAINASNQFLLNPLVNQAGVYTLIVTNTVTGCTATDQMTVFPGPLIASQQFSVTHVSCQSVSPGAIDLTVNFGTAPHTYLWSNGALTEDISNLTAGIYTVSVTDATGCTYTGKVTILQNGPAFTLDVIQSDPTCSGGSDGTINLSVVGSQPPYTFNWTGPNSFSSNLEDLSGLTAGNYQITVTDQGLCTQVASITLSNPAGALSLTATATPAFCGNNGAVDLTPQGAFTPFTYDWDIDGAEDPDNDTEDISDLPVGFYTVTVTDANGCTAVSGPHAVSAPSPLQISADVEPDPCSTGTDGAVDVSVSGGSGGYAFLWSTAATTEDLSQVAAGIYGLTVTDANGCSITASYSVLHESTIPNGSFTVQNASCEAGVNDGAITLNQVPTDAQAPLQFLWQGPAGFSSNNQNIANLQEGAYQFAITDANNCVLSATLEVLKTPGSFTVTLNTTDAVCNGLATGAIDASVANSTGSLSFIWSNNQATEDLTNITAGIYTITVSDTNGCSKTASATVGEASPIVITGVATNPICFGDANGSINLSVTGGAGGYSFLWSNNSASEDVLGLTGGDYSVTVTDLLGCVKSASFTLIQAPSPIQLIANVHHPLCFNETGSIDLFVFGGIGSSFVVNWSSGGVPTTQGLSELQAGTYTVTATDVNGCSASTSATVVAPAALAIGSSGISNIACNTGNSGIIQITAAGGTMPYTYDWSDDGAEFPDNDFQILFNVGPGSYTITITDANGCTFSSPVYEVTGTPSISALASTLSNSCDIAVLQATVSGGVPDFAYQWTGPNNFTSTTQVITAPFGGFYHLIVTDVNGCSASSTTLVELAGAGICGYLRGHVIHDQLENCVWDTNESGLSGWLVRAEGIDTLYGVTDATGQYLIQAPSGDYTIAVIAPNNLWEVCLVPSSATLTNPGDTVFVADIPVKSPFTCPLLRVSIGTNQLRRCFSNNYYYVEYCNEGTETADNAYVVVTLDPLINFISSNIPSTFLGNQQYQFNVGNLDIGECGWFNIKVNVDCNAVLGQTHCTVAHIYPDSLCNTNTLWSGAELDITGRCTADSLHFVVKNTGSGNVVGALDYIVVEDAVMRMMAPVPMLPPGDSIRIHVPANGSTWRMEVEQEIYHPTPTPVSLSVEGCTTGAQFSTGFVNQFPLGDESPATDEDCTTNVGSYDPNDKHGYPIGYGAEHYIRPGTEIEYMIRFQNTGTDTAFNIVVLDTLSELLDPATIRFGTSSHPYQFDLTGGGIVHFYFDNIMLPDSFVNEPLSHGFVKFTITPNAQAPLESLIENQAAIYFDFNEPVITNTTRHRLGENFLTVHAWQPIVRQVGIAVAPNPFNSNAVFTVSGLTNTDPLQLEVFDSFGKAVAFLASETHQFTFSRTTLGAGIYAFSVRQNGRLVGSGKFMVE